MYSKTDNLTIRTPTPEDGATVWSLVEDCPPLDPNSMYCNLLQCTHFAGTSAIAKEQQNTLGFISGYLIPERDDTLFIWQVAIHEAARGRGLATQMLKHILEQPNCHDVTHLETTITTSNNASWGLFEGLAAKLDTDLERSVLFDKQEHFAGGHETENLLRIGPFNSREI